MRTLVSIGLISLAALSFAADMAVAANEDMSLPSDSRIKLLEYDDSDVYTITTKYGYQTNIVFGTGEEIQTISVGDRSLWQIVPSGNRMFIRPMDDDVITNMTVLTNRHSYQFDLKSISAEAKGENIYVARFVYPDDRPMPAAPVYMNAPVYAPVAPQPAPAVIVPAPVPAPIAKTPMKPVSGPGVSYPVHPNYNYTYSGPDRLAPLQVYDDGRKTHILYATPRSVMPNLYKLQAGAEVPVSYSVQGKNLVIDDIASEWALKDSNGTIRIYNETLNPR